MTEYEASVLQQLQAIDEHILSLHQDIRAVLDALPILYFLLSLLSGLLFASIFFRGISR